MWVWVSVEMKMNKNDSSCEWHKEQEWVNKGKDEGKTIYSSFFRHVAFITSADVSNEAHKSTHIEKVIFI